MPIAETGEIAVHGPQVMAGYWIQSVNYILHVRTQTGYQS